MNSFLRGGPRWRFSEENGSFFFIGTDEHKKLRTSAGVVFSQAAQDNFSFFEISGSVDYQPTNAIRISLRPEYAINPNKTQYVSQANTNGTTRSITGEIDQQTLSATLRINYTINPNLTIQYYGQPFIAKGKYSNFNFVTDANAENLNNRVQLYTDTQISFENDFNTIIDNQLLKAKPENTFLVKWTYRFVL